MALEKEPSEPVRPEGREMALEHVAAPVAPRVLFSLAVVMALIGMAVAYLFGLPAMLPLGIALLFGSTGALGAAPHVVGLAARPRESAVVLRASDGVERPLPRSSVRGARCVRQMRQVGNRSRSVEVFSVWLETYDGGRIVVGDGLRERSVAERLEADVQALIDAVPIDEAAERGLITEARRRLEASSDVEVRVIEPSSTPAYREAARPGLELRFSSGRTLGRSLLLPIAVLGLTGVLAGVVAVAVAWLALFVLAVGGLVTLASAGVALGKRGARQRVVLHADTLTLVEERGAKTASERDLPLRDVGAVDLDPGGRLTIRLRAANAALERAAEASTGTDPEALRQAIGGVGALFRGTINLAATGLRHEDRIAIARLLSAEVTERTARGTS